MNRRLATTAHPSDHRHSFPHMSLLLAVLLIVGFKLPWWWHLIATIVWLLKQSARFVEKAQ